MGRRCPTGWPTRNGGSMSRAEVLHDHLLVRVVVEPLPGAVGRAVIDDDDLVAELAKMADALGQESVEFVLDDQARDEIHVIDLLHASKRRSVARPIKPSAS